MDIKLEDMLIIFALSYFAIIILPYLFFGFELNYGWTSIPDLIDLIFYVPVMGILYIAIYNKLKNEVAQHDHRWDYIVYLVVFIHFEGHGFHWAANALHEYAKIVGASEEFLRIAYFLDEIVSHIIFFSGLFFYFVLLAIIELSENHKADEINMYKVLFAGVFFSFVFTISTIEGQYILYNLILSVIYLAVSVYLLRIGQAKIDRNILWFFWMVVTGVVLVWAGVYYAIFGSLRQPSELGVL